MTRRQQHERYQSNSSVSPLSPVRRPPRASGPLPQPSGAPARRKSPPWGRGGGMKGSRHPTQYCFQPDASRFSISVCPYATEAYTSRQPGGICAVFGDPKNSTLCDALSHSHLPQGKKARFLIGPTRHISCYPRFVRPRYDSPLFTSRAPSPTP